MSHSKLIQCHRPEEDEMPRWTLRDCPVDGCARLCLTFLQDLPKEFWVKKGGDIPIFSFFDEHGVPETCFMGSFNKNHKQVICGICDSNDGKVFNRGLESSCINIEQLVQMYGQENRQDENV